MATLHEAARRAPTSSCVKGAAERVLALCERALMTADGGVAPRPRTGVPVAAVPRGVCRRGLRVLAFAVVTDVDTAVGTAVDVRSGRRSGPSARAARAARPAPPEALAAVAGRAARRGSR